MSAVRVVGLRSLFPPAGPALSSSLPCSPLPAVRAFRAFAPWWGAPGRPAACVLASPRRPCWPLAGPVAPSGVLPGPGPAPRSCPRSLACLCAAVPLSPPELVYATRRRDSGRPSPSPMAWPSLRTIRPLWPPTPTGITSLVSTSPATADLRDVGSGPTSARALQTVSASTPTAPPGTATCRISAAHASPKAAKFCFRHHWTGNRWRFQRSWRCRWRVI